MVLERTAIIKLSSPTGFGTQLANEVASRIENPLILDADSIVKLQSDRIENTMNQYRKLVFIMPEFNGSFPAAFKTIVDYCGWPNVLKDTPIFLVGLSGGFSGNVVGVNHMKHILEYVDADVYRKASYFTFNGKKNYESEINILQSHISDWETKTK